jgi:predicted amidohydrolase YtcJ
VLQLILIPCCNYKLKDKILISKLFMNLDKKAFINGKIYTVNSRQPLTETVVTCGNKILYAGSDSGAKNYIDAGTEIINLNGRLMLPGFIDGHTHFINGGFYLLGLNLKQASTSDEFIELLRNYVNKHKGKWITGGNWDHENWGTKELPVKEMIDPFTPDTPVFIERLDKHMALANSLALKLAGITKDTPVPAGGVIVKDASSGEPTGILKDNAMPMVYSVIPEPAEAEFDNAALAALEEAKRFGITGIHDITYKNDLQTYQRLEKDGRLSCRVYTRQPIAEYNSLTGLGIQHNFGSSKIKIGSLKAFSDGSLGAGTAWFFDNYFGDNSSGLPTDIVSDGRLEKFALDTDKNNLQLSIHAIGDRANSYVLDLFEKIAEVNPVWDRRFRIEHAQHLRQQDIQRFAKLKVIASVQPYHLFDDGAWAENKIGKERVKEAFSYKSLLDAGVILSLGSDWTVAPLNPLLGIYAAVTRHTSDGRNPEGWIPGQKINVEEAIKGYTINNAYASFQENILGSIEPGKLADFVALDNDILTIEPGKIKDVKVDMTIFEGEIIYKRS